VNDIGGAIALALILGLIYGVFGHGLKEAKADKWLQDLQRDSRIWNYFLVSIVVGIGAIAVIAHQASK
jgi:hypothetical protein